MNLVFRAVAVYLFIYLIFRLSGKRSLAEMTSFDLILLLIISEATQEALIGEDFSLTAAMLVITTLAAVDVGLSIIKQRWPRVEKILDSLPLIIVEDGKPLRERMDKERVDEEDVLHAARRDHGLERLDQVKFAVLERNGGISIIPRESR